MGHSKVVSTDLARKSIFLSSGEWVIVRDGSPVAYDSWWWREGAGNTSSPSVPALDRALLYPNGSWVAVEETGENYVVCEQSLGEIYQMRVGSNTRDCQYVLDVPGQLQTSLPADGMLREYLVLDGLVSYNEAKIGCEAQDLSLVEPQTLDDTNFTLGDGPHLNIYSPVHTTHFPVFLLVLLQPSPTAVTSGLELKQPSRISTALMGL